MKLLAVIFTIIFLLGCSAKGNFETPELGTVSFSLPVLHKDVDVSFEKADTIYCDDGTSECKILTFTYKSSLDNAKEVMQTTILELVKMVGSKGI